MWRNVPHKEKTSREALLLSIPYNLTKKKNIIHTSEKHIVADKKKIFLAWFRFVKTTCD